MKGYVVIATKDEINLIDDRYRNFPIIITGVGGTNVVRALNDIPRDTMIVNIGYAGGLNLKVGEVCQIGCCSTFHPNVVFDEKVFTLKYGDMMCYTSGDFVLREQVIDQTERCVFDMELAYILAMGFENVVSFKKVSDNLNLKQYEKTVNK